MAPVAAGIEASGLAAQGLGAGRQTD